MNRLETARRAAFIAKNAYSEAIAISDAAEQVFNAAMVEFNAAKAEAPEYQAATAPTAETPTFKAYDIVRFDTGTEYVVSGTRTDRGGGMIAVSGWKNGKPFGAYRVINGARCVLIGRTEQRKAGGPWKFTPITK